MTIITYSFAKKIKLIMIFVTDNQVALFLNGSTLSTHLLSSSYKIKYITSQRMF